MSIRFAFLIGALALAGCPGTRGSGVAKTESRTLAAFDEVEVTAGIDADVRAGAPGPIVVSADDNLLPLVETRVDGHRLHVGFASGHAVSQVSPVEVKVPVESVRALAVSGGAHLRATGIASDQVGLDASSGGSLKATGKAKNVDASASSGASLDAEGLVAETATIGASSGAHVSLYATSSATGSASSGASVHVAGGASNRSIATTSGGSTHFD
jgi:hypothetical protein